MVDECLRAHRRRQPAPERVHPRDGRRGAPAGGRGRSRTRGRRRPRAAARRARLGEGSVRHRGHGDDGGVARPRGHRGAATTRSPIARLRRAGAVIVGKTNLHEFAFGTTNEDSAFGPARNPLDDTRSPGGSSGGSAASVVAGMALATLGTDTGGSIRIPAAACGLVGLKPAYGELPAHGVVPLSRTLDHVGPLTPTVTDAWHMLHALRDRAPVNRSRRRRFGALRLRFRDGTSATCWMMTCAPLRGGAGHAAPPARRSSTSTFRTRRSSRPVYLHIVFGDAAAYHADTLDTMPERYTPNVRLRLEMARYVTAEDYVRALEGRRTLAREVDAALSGVRRAAAADAADRRAADWRGDGAGRRRPRAGAQHDAAAHAALQPHRPSGHLAAVRQPRHRPALRAAAGRRRGADRQPAARRARRRDWRSPCYAPAQRDSAAHSAPIVCRVSPASVGHRDVAAARPAEECPAAARA